jgi:hypothetical protein
LRLGDAGFGEVEVADDAAGRVKVSTFHVGFPLAGGFNGSR